MHTVRMSSFIQIRKTFRSLIPPPSIHYILFNLVSSEGGKPTCLWNPGKPHSHLSSQMKMTVTPAVHDPGKNEILAPVGSLLLPAELIMCLLCSHPSCWKKHWTGEGQGKPTPGDHLWASHQLFGFHKLTSFRWKLLRGRDLRLFCLLTPHMIRPVLSTSQILSK